MRTLTSTLEAEQQKASIDPLIKIVLTHGDTEHTFDLERILDSSHTEEPYSQKLELTLDNSDGVLTGLDLKGYKGVISYGAVTDDGDEYSDCAPLTVISQRLNSSPGILDCTLSLVGIPNLMAEDKASESYLPDDDDSKTVKTLINSILGATIACFHSDDDCIAYDCVFDSEDDLIDTYKPKDSFRIYTGGSRLSAIRRLLDLTKCAMIFKADGKGHVFVPTTSGAVYSYEYSLED